MLPIVILLKLEQANYIPKAINKNIAHVALHDDMLLFNQETVTQNNELTRHLHTAYRKAIQKYGELNTKQRDVVTFPALTMEVVKLLNKALKTSFINSQVYYTQGYRALINLICTTLLPAKMLIVMASPVKQQIRDTIAEVTDRVAYLKADKFGISLDALEQLCIQKRVGIVYMSSRMPCPFGYPQLRERTTRLLLLRDRYDF